MAPRPQEQTTADARDVPVAADGEQVVISGMAGLYPKARYVKDFENILYNKENPISSEDLRWKYNHPEVAQFTGNVPELDRFDAQFFKVHYRLGNSMDSMSRKILEQTYEAIYDAGTSPEHLSGKKVGVYIGTCFSETEKACFYVASSRTGFGIAGCSKAMFANRISYWLNAKGPSVSIDQACCSSTAALEAAYKAISCGECDAAIVGGAYLCLHPQSSVHYGRIMKISMDGKTKSFAEDAAGCAKSEAINVLFLQKAKDAKRIYANVVHVKSEYVSILKEETGPQYGFYRNPADTAKFMQSVYEEVGVSPKVVEYVEAFGSAVPEADKSELDAIDKVFCSERKEPLLVGSVMSNIGYGEAASGISAITKVLLGYHKGLLAGNLNCGLPRSDVEALRKGRMRVLTDHQHFNRTYAAVNSLSVTGTNAHVLLHGHYKRKDLARYKCSFPRLVTISGRQDTAVERALELLKSHPVDPEELALLHNIHETNISGHLGKGYIILDTNGKGQTVSLSQCAEYCDGAQRPLWFVYSGMGSQWAGMGTQLMRIPIFAAAIERCRKVLEPKGLDIVHILTSPDKKIFDNILHSFVGIAAVQIGLTDVLMQLGLVPDNIIGHSVGELGCAYADGCLTAEEMILAAYSRGRVSLETHFIHGSMAAVGVGAQQMSSMCPPEIAVACHNSAESCTISGPADNMRAFVADLTARGLFAKEVPCSNIAYHSRYIAEAGPGLLGYLKEVIKNPVVRSERWVSSSVPRERWGEELAKYSSAEYHTNNLLSPVLFEEASALIPSDAVLVEIAPHGLLQAILKRALPASSTNIPLTRRGHQDNVVMLLDAIGKLYLHGYNPKVRLLYPEVEFPVSTGTPFLSHYVDWAHQDKWSLPLYQSASRSRAASCTFVLSIHDKEYSYLEGHVIRNKSLVPFSFALVAVWDTLAMSLDVPKKSLCVEFSNVQLYVQPILHKQKTVKFSVSLHKGNGMFEVMHEDSTVSTGYINVIKPSKKENITDTEIQTILKDNELSNQDVYNALYERGYAYSGVFRGIFSANRSMSDAKIMWKDNWVTFIDSMFQLNALKYTDSGVSQPDRILRMIIDPESHQNSIKSYKAFKNNSVTLLDATLTNVNDKTSGNTYVTIQVQYHCNSAYYTKRIDVEFYQPDKSLVPFSFALVAVWDTLAMSLDVPKKSLCVEFSNVQLYVQPILHKQKTVKFSVSLHKGNGMFEVMHEDSTVSTGYINVIKPSKKENITDTEIQTILKDNELSNQDVYNALYERGYAYSGVFRGIFSANRSMSDAKIMWKDNWVTFIDSMFQLNALKYTDSGVSQPDRILRMIIDPESHQNSIKSYKAFKNNSVTLLDATLTNVNDKTSCGGFVMENIRFRDISFIKNDKTTLETLNFIPRFNSKLDIKSSLYIFLQIVAENVAKGNINVIGLNSYCNEELFTEMERIAENGIPGTKIHYRRMCIDTPIHDDNAMNEVNLVIIRNLSKNERISQRFHRMLQRSVFIIDEENISSSAAELFPMNFYKIVSNTKNTQTQLELACWRPIPTATLTSAFTVRTESDLPLLIHSRNNCSSENGILVLASYPPVPGLANLVKKWRKESTRNKIHVIMINEKSRDNVNSNFDVPDVNLAFNVFDNGVWGGEYFLPLKETKMEKDSVALQSEVIGDLKSLQWVRTPELPRTELSIAVQYAGINMSDVNRALGLNSNTDKQHGYGMDFSGITKRGERVMGLVPNGAASSYVMAHPELTWPVPDFWTLEDAATVPLAYVFAYYCLLLKPTSRILTNAIKKQQYSVLIHGGSGALGQAAIRIAVARGWRVFTTVKDQHKKKFLMKLFPQLNENDIGNSRDATFADMVLSATRGIGCNVVLCCLKGYLKNASLKCCAASSTVVDVSQISTNENYVFGMYNLTNEKSYVAVDIRSIFSDHNPEKNKTLHSLMSEGISSGEVVPLTRVTFAQHETARAFRLLAASRHRGRVLLALRNQLALCEQPRDISGESSCHIIISDSDPLGLQVADKLIESGVKRIQVHLQEEIGYVLYKQSVWEKKNVIVAVTYGNLEEINRISYILHNATKLGSVESVHLVAYHMHETVIKKIDLATRNACPNLKKFVVISNDAHRGQTTCIQRIKDGLPAIFLDLSMLKSYQDSEGRQWCYSAVGAIEQAWYTTEPVVVALPKHTPQKSILQQIMALTDLNISNCTSNSDTLESLGLPLEKSAVVAAFLKDQYNTYLSEESISQLTLERLRQIEGKITDRQFMNVHGLEAFFSFVDSDELLATTETVFLPTLTKNYEMRDDELDINQSTLCIVPGLEGHHARFRTLCERLKLPAAVLQPGLDHPRETSREQAERYSKILLKMGVKDKFYLLGYETGVYVALELAAILEEHGATGTVFCLGDGPEETRALLEWELREFTSDEALEEAVTRHMVSLMAAGSRVQVAGGAWAARVDAAVRSLLGLVSHSAQYARALLHAARARIHTARRTVLQPRALRSRLVLLQARNDLRTNSNSPQLTDSKQELTINSLQQFSQKPIIIHPLAAPMAHITADLQVSSIINSYLDEDLLQAFENKNLCDTYLMNADAFMTSSE